MLLFYTVGHIGRQLMPSTQTQRDRVTLSLWAPIVCWEHLVTT